MCFIKARYQIVYSIQPFMQKRVRLVTICSLSIRHLWWVEQKLIIPVTSKGKKGSGLGAGKEEELPL